MKTYKYLIIGGGMTGDAAVHGIRELDPDGAIALFSLEPDPPYERPPLTKDLWKGKSIETIWKKTAGPGVDLYLQHRIQEIKPEYRQVVDERGEIFTYEKLLIASGGTPRHLPFGGDAILYYRTVADYRRLKKMSENAKRFAILGGGFIGSEIAAGLAMNGKEVTMLFPEEGIGARVYPPEISKFITGFFAHKGVSIRAGEMVASVEKLGEEIIVSPGGNQKIAVDGVIAGIGITPNLDLARSIGLSITNGIAVDEFLQASPSGIFAAGDVAEFYNPALGKRIRVEHADNAKSMGRAVGRNMAGAHEPFTYLPFFYSDLFELGYEAIGELDARLETYVDWIDPFKKGVIYYLREGRVRGVLLWNVWNQVDSARDLIALPGPFQAPDLKGRLPSG